MGPKIMLEPIMPSNDAIDVNSPPPPPPPPPPVIATPNIMMNQRSTAAATNATPPPPPPPTTTSSSGSTGQSGLLISPVDLISLTRGGITPRSHVEFSADQFNYRFNRHQQQQQQSKHGAIQTHHPKSSSSSLKKCDYYFSQPYYPYYYRQYYLNNFGFGGTNGASSAAASKYRLTNKNNNKNTSNNSNNPSGNHYNHHHHQQRQSMLFGMPLSSPPSMTFNGGGGSSTLYQSAPPISASSSTSALLFNGSSTPFHQRISTSIPQLQLNFKRKKKKKSSSFCSPSSKKPNKRIMMMNGNGNVVLTNGLMDSNGGGNGHIMTRNNNSKVVPKFMMKSSGGGQNFSDGEHHNNNHHLHLSSNGYHLNNNNNNNSKNGHIINVKGNANSNDEFRESLFFESEGEEEPGMEEEDDEDIIEEEEEEEEQEEGDIETEIHRRIDKRRTNSVSNNSSNNNNKTTLMLNGSNNLQMQVGGASGNNSMINIVDSNCNGSQTQQHQQQLVKKISIPTTASATTCAISIPGHHPPPHLPSHAHPLYGSSTTTNSTTFNPKRRSKSLKMILCSYILTFLVMLIVAGIAFAAGLLAAQYIKPFCDLASTSSSSATLSSSLSSLSSSSSNGELNNNNSVSSSNTSIPLIRNQRLGRNRIINTNNSSSSSTGNSMTTTNRTHTVLNDAFNNLNNQKNNSTNDLVFQATTTVKSTVMPELSFGENPSTKIFDQPLNNTNEILISPEPSMGDLNSDPNQNGPNTTSLVNELDPNKELYEIATTTTTTITSIIPETENSVKEIPQISSTLTTTEKPEATTLTPVDQVNTTTTTTSTRPPTTMQSNIFSTLIREYNQALNETIFDQINLNDGTLSALTTTTTTDSTPSLFDLNPNRIPSLDFLDSNQSGSNLPKPETNEDANIQTSSTESINNQPIATATTIPSKDESINEDHNHKNDDNDDDDDNDDSKKQIKLGQEQRENPSVKLIENSVDSTNLNSFSNQNETDTKSISSSNDTTDLTTVNTLNDLSTDRSSINETVKSNDGDDFNTNDNDNNHNHADELDLIEDLISFPSDENNSNQAYNNTMINVKNDNRRDLDLENSSEYESIDSTLNSNDTTIIDNTTNDTDTNVNATSTTIKDLVTTTTAKPEPPTPTCLDNQFQCNQTSECMHKSRICDGIVDCPVDNFDENDCFEKNCGTNFRCGSYKLSSKTDIDIDNSTLLFANQTIENQLMMMNNLSFANNNKNDAKCIPRSHYCDGVWDCQDGSDEINCRIEKCEPNFVLCRDNSACITGKQACDGVYNCRDRSDEAGCGIKTDCEESGKFYCNQNSLCINRTLVCDGVIDCDNGADEKDCVTKDVCKLEDSKFFCPNSAECINLSKRCDGKQDCLDYSDEDRCVETDLDNFVYIYYGEQNHWSLFCAPIDFNKNDADNVCSQMGMAYAKKYSLEKISRMAENSTWAILKPQNQPVLKTGKSSLLLQLITSKISNDSDLNDNFSSYSIQFETDCENSLALKIECEHRYCDSSSQAEIGNDSPQPEQPTTILVNNHQNDHYQSNELKNNKSLSLSIKCHAYPLSPQWLLISGQCLIHLQQKNEMFIHFKGKTFNIIYSRLHPRYSVFRTRRYPDYDLALIKINGSLPKNSLIQSSICLPSSKLDQDITCFIGNYKNGDSAFKVLDHYLCNSSNHFNGSVTDRQICASNMHEDGSKNYCLPPNLPLVCLSSHSHWYVAGFQSYQRGCDPLTGKSVFLGYAPHPTLFSNVFSMKDFIEQTIGTGTYRQNRTKLQDCFNCTPNQITKESGRVFFIVKGSEEDKKLEEELSQSNNSYGTMDDDSFNTTTTSAMKNMTSTTTIIDQSNGTTSLPTTTAVQPELANDDGHEEEISSNITAIHEDVQNLNNTNSNLTEIVENENLDTNLENTNITETEIALLETADSNPSILNTDILFNNTNSNDTMIESSTIPIFEDLTTTPETSMVNEANNNSSNNDNQSIQKNEPKMNISMPLVSNIDSEPVTSVSLEKEKEQQPTTTLGPVNILNETFEKTNELNRTKENEEEISFNGKNETISDSL